MSSSQRSRRGAPINTSRRLAVEMLERRELLNSDGTLLSFQTIGDGAGGGPSLADRDWFGSAVSPLGDLDGDGVTELGVGAEQDENITNGLNRGALHVLFMNTDGTVRTSQEISGVAGGGPPLANNDWFGSSVSPLGDLDGDGIADLAVGKRGDETGGREHGAVNVLFMNSNGTVKSSQKIAEHLGGGPSLDNWAYFGSSVAALGDMNGDGISELAVGAPDEYSGSTYVLFLNADGTAQSSQRIASGVGGGPTLSGDDFFGSDIVSLGDLDGDGVKDLAVGAEQDDTGGTNRGAVHILLMNADGTVKSSSKIASGTSGGPALADFDRFGRSLTSLGDQDGDGVSELVVGAYGDDTGGSNRGAVYVLFLNSDGTVKSSNKIAHGTNGLTLDNRDRFGRSVASLGDLNQDGSVDLAVGAIQDDTGGTDRGAVHVLFLTPTAPTANVAATVINGGQTNRSGIATLMMQFSEPVTLSGPEALMWWNHTTGSAASVAGASLAGNGTNELTWDLTGAAALPAGYYTATLPNSAGLASTHSALLLTQPGDSTGDGQVGFADFGELAANFNVQSGPVYGPGDMDGDTDVGFADFGILAANFNANLTAPATDGGDAGGGFPTAEHIIGSGLALGAAVGSDDGVSFGTLQAGNNAATVTISATVPAGGNASLNAFVDFNDDGDWDDAGERVLVDHALSNGENALTMSVPAGAAVGQVTARFRVSSIVGYGAAGLAVDGEVEDYDVTIVSARESSRRVATLASLHLWSDALVTSPTGGLSSVDPQGQLDGRYATVPDKWAQNLVDSAVFDVPKTTQPEAISESATLDDELVDLVLGDDGPGQLAPVGQSDLS